MGVSYSCMKYGVFITPGLKLYKFVYNTNARGRENHVFDKFLSGGRLDKDAVCFFGRSS